LLAMLRRAIPILQPYFSRIHWLHSDFELPSDQHIAGKRPEVGIVQLWLDEDQWWTMELSKQSSESEAKELVLYSLQKPSLDNLIHTR